MKIYINNVWVRTKITLVMIAWFICLLPFFVILPIAYVFFGFGLEDYMDFFIDKAESYKWDLM